MRNIVSEMYVRNTISVIEVSSTGETILDAVWKQKKQAWYVMEPGSRNIKDVLTPRKFHEAIQKGKYSLHL